MSTGPIGGEPWPDASFGEVVGPAPNFARSYTPSVAAPLVGRSAKWAKWLINQGKVSGYRESAGHRRWFLDAEAFESFCNAQGLWPPKSLSDDPDWQVLALRQERDLEELRATIRALGSDTPNSRTNSHARESSGTRHW